MENKTIKEDSCHICKMHSENILFMKCQHNICQNCIYILILFNKHSLEHFINNKFEEELEVYCVCMKGFFKLVYSNKSKNYKIYNDEGEKVLNFNLIMIKNEEESDFHLKFKNGLENLKQINNEIFFNENSNQNFNEIVKLNKDSVEPKSSSFVQQTQPSNIKKLCDGCEQVYSSVYCYDCASFSCKGCFENIHSVYKKFSVHRKTENLNELCDSLQTCKIHNKRYVYHCLTCNQYICIDCINDEKENSHEDHHQEYISDFFPTRINENISYLENLKIEEKIVHNKFKQNFYLEKTDEKINEINFFLKNQINILEKLRVSMVNSLNDFKKDIVKNHKIISYVFECLNRDINNKDLDKINFINLMFEKERDNFSNVYEHASESESKDINNKNTIEMLIKNIEDNTILSNLPSVNNLKKEFEEYSNNLYFNFIKNSITHQKIEKENLKLTQFSLSNYLFNHEDRIYFMFPNNLDSNIYVIDVETKKEAFILKYHEENVNMFRIFRKKTKDYLITSSDDGSIVIWNLCEFFKEHKEKQDLIGIDNEIPNKQTINGLVDNKKKESTSNFSDEINKRFKVIDTEEENLVSFTIISYDDDFNKSSIIEKSFKKLNFDHLICSYNTSTIHIYDLYKLDVPLDILEFDYDIIIVNNYIDVKSKSILLIGESEMFIEILKYEIKTKENKMKIKISPFKKFKKEGENKYFSNFMINKIYSDEFIVYNDGVKIKFISLKDYELLNVFILSDLPISSLYFLENDLLVYTTNNINFIKIDYFKFLEKTKYNLNNYDQTDLVDIFKIVNILENNKKEIHSLSAAKLIKDNLEFNYISIITGESTIKIFEL